MSKPSARHSSNRDLLRWFSLGLVAALAYLLVGAAPVVIGAVARGLAAGAVVGVAARARGDIGVCALVAAAASLAGSLVAGPWVSSITPEAPLSPVHILIGAAVGALAAAGLAALRVGAGRTAATVVALALIALGFLWTAGVLPGPQTARRAELRTELAAEPVDEGYAFDGALYLKTLYLMDRGIPYYQAFTYAYGADSRLNGAPASVFGVRQPWAYQLWKWLPGATGVKVRDWFLLLSLAAAFAAWWGVGRFASESVALLAACVVLGYAISASFAYGFILPEAWAGLAALVAVMAMLRDRPYLAAWFVVVAFGLRELAAWLLPAYGVWWYFSARRRARTLPALGIALLGPMILYATHLAMLPNGGQAGASIAAWLNASVATFFGALRYMNELAPGSDLLYPLAPVAALAAAWAVRERAERWMIVTATIGPVLLLAVFSSGEWGDYWGLVAMPTILALATLVFTRLLPAEKPAL